MGNALRWVVTVAGLAALVFELCACDPCGVEVAADCDPERWDPELSCCLPAQGPECGPELAADCDPERWSPEQSCCLQDAAAARGPIATVTRDGPVETVTQ